MRALLLVADGVLVWPGRGQSGGRGERGGGEMGEREREGQGGGAGRENSPDTYKDTNPSHRGST